MRRTVVALLGIACGAMAAAADTESSATAGVTILGDQDSALGLFLAPWKEESAADLGRPPALQDPQPATVDAAAYARTHRYYQTGRAYRAERLRRNQ